MSLFFSTGEEILYGTTDGKLGLVQIGEQSAVAKWEINNVKKKGGMLWFIPGCECSCFLLFASIFNDLVFLQTSTWCSKMLFFNIFFSLVRNSLH